MTTAIQRAVPQALEVYDAAARKLVRITRQTFLKDWALPVVQRKFNSHDTALACLNSYAPSIGQLKSAFGEYHIEAYIEGWIVNLREFLSVGKGMTDAQSREAAMLIVATFPNLNIADVNLIFKRIKLGRLGKIYDRLDGQVLLEMFDLYFTERCNEASEQSIREGESMSFPAHDSPARLSKLLEKAMPKGKFGK